jgi:hypothetical protein
MARVKRFIPAALFVAGLAVGLTTAGRPGPPPGPARTETAGAFDVPGGTIKITELFDAETSGVGKPAVTEVVPWRIEENGQATDFEGAERLPRMWILSIDGGRIRVFGTSR